MTVHLSPYRRASISPLVILSSTALCSEAVCLCGGRWDGWMAGMPADSKRNGEAKKGRAPAKTKQRSKSPWSSKLLNLNSASSWICLKQKVFVSTRPFGRLASAATACATAQRCRGASDSSTRSEEKGLCSLRKGVCAACVKYIAGGLARRGAPPRLCCRAGTCTRRCPSTAPTRRSRSGTAPSR